jgi:uncharacterized protein YbcI
MPGQTKISQDARPSEAISTAVVGLLNDYTGRGASRARTVFEEDVVIVLLEDTMSAAESGLAKSGEEEYVLGLRRKLQLIMRSDLEGAVEQVTGRRVIAFLVDNHLDPDISAETFVLEPLAGGV